MLIMSLQRHILTTLFLLIFAWLFCVSCSETKAAGDKSESVQPIASEKTARVNGSACESATVLADSSIRTVRHAALRNYPQTTIGQAFEGTFHKRPGEPCWESQESSKGVRTVLFRGQLALGELPRIGEVPMVYTINEAVHMVDETIDEIERACRHTPGALTITSELDRAPNNVDPTFEPRHDQLEYEYSVCQYQHQDCSGPRMRIDELEKAETARSETWKSRFADLQNNVRECWTERRSKTLVKVKAEFVINVDNEVELEGISSSPPLFANEKNFLDLIYH